MCCISKYRLAIFDLDGTILNTLDDLHDSLVNSLQAEGMPILTLPETRQRVGNGIAKLIQRAAPEGTSEEALQRLLVRFKDYYIRHQADKTRPYNGIPEAIATLRQKGIKTAVVSNKTDDAVQSLCAKFFPDAFNAIRGEIKGIPRKPAPDMVNAILKELDISAEQALYIGDSEVDAETARNAGVDAMLVTWGFRDRTLLETLPHKFLVDSPDEIIYAFLDTGENMKTEVLQKFTNFAKSTLFSTELTKFEKKIRLQTEFRRQNDILVDDAELQQIYKETLSKIEALPMEDFHSTECKALDIVVKRLVDTPPVQVQSADQSNIPLPLWNLFDGESSLLECIRVFDAKNCHDNEKTARTSRDGIKSIIATLKVAEQNDFCKLIDARKTLRPEEFEEAIRQLGVKEGMNIVVHSAFSALGNVTGGPDAICAIMEKIIGPEGTLLMPAFVQQIYNPRGAVKPPFDVKNTTTSTGILGDAFRRRQGVLRSYDPCHSWACWGRNARRYIEKHHLVTTVGPMSPLGQLEKDDGWCMTISCWDCVTFMHVVEESNHVPCLSQRTEEYDVILPNGQKERIRTWSWRAATCDKCPARRTPELFQMMRNQKALREIMLGNAHICLFPLSAYRMAYESLLKGICGKNPAAVPRQVVQSVPSDWDVNRQCPMENSSAYIGKYIE